MVPQNGAAYLIDGSATKCNEVRTVINVDALKIALDIQVCSQIWTIVLPERVRIRAWCGGITKRSNMGKVHLTICHPNYQRAPCKQASAVAFAGTHHIAAACNSRMHTLPAARLSFIIP